MGPLPFHRQETLSALVWFLLFKLYTWNPTTCMVSFLKRCKKEMKKISRNLKENMCPTYTKEFLSGTLESLEVIFLSKSRAISTWGGYTCEWHFLSTTSCTKYRTWKSNYLYEFHTSILIKPTNRLTDRTINYGMECGVQSCQQELEW